MLFSHHDAFPRPRTLVLGHETTTTARPVRTGEPTYTGMMLTRHQQRVLDEPTR